MKNSETTYNKSQAIFETRTQAKFVQLNCHPGERLPELGRAGRMAREVLRGGGEGAAADGEKGGLEQEEGHAIVAFDPNPQRQPLSAL